MIRYPVEDDWWSFYSWCYSIRCPAFHDEMGCLGYGYLGSTDSCVHDEVGLSF